MSGGINIYEKYLTEKTFRPIALQVLAAGALRLSRNYTLHDIRQIKYRLIYNNFFRD